MPRLQAESTISHYKVKDLIASGGMGEVYRALDLQLGRVVALKTIVSAKAGDSATHRRFLREARAASILSHPSICTIYEIGQEGDLTFIAMQYIGGKALDCILSEEQLSVETVLSYALDVTEALEEAHRSGVVHRDIKPSNIIVNERGMAVVLDFGLAKQFSFAGALNEELSTLINLTSEAAIVGTVPYMSPEQIRGEPLDGRSDIFSFGITLYEMLSGARPFQNPSKIELLHAILHDDPIPLTEISTQVDERLGAIVGKALRKDPGERYQSASEFKTDILTYIQEHGFKVRGLSATSSQSRPVEISFNSQSQAAITLPGLIASPAFQRLALVLVSLAVVIGLISWFIIRRFTGSEASAVLRHVQLVNWKSEPGEYGSDAVFSRDGRMIAFSSLRGGRKDIWIKQTTMGDPNQITRGEWSSWNPIWSPDNQELAFLSNRGDETGVWRIPALGGTPALIATLSTSVLRLNYWSKDGATLYYESYPNLFALNIASGQKTQVTSFEASEHSDDLNFSVSPTGDRVVFVDRKNGQVDLWVMPLRGRSPVRVTNDLEEDSNPVWAPDGKRIIYSCLRDGTYQICVASVDGHEPVQITSGESDKFVSDVSADGRGILYSVSKEESDIWAVQTDTGMESEITSDPGVELWPSVSPDGKTIAYQSISDPAQGRKLNKSFVLTGPATGGGQHIQLAADAINPTWSPDGKKLAFLRASGESWNIWTVNDTGGNEKQVSTHRCDIVFSVLPYNRVEAEFFAWSPDASKIAYPSRGEHDSNLWIVSADGSGEMALANSAEPSLACPLWLPDNSAVAYVAMAKRNSTGGKSIWSIRLADLKSNKPVSILESTSALRLLGWSEHGDELLVATIESQGLSAKAPDVRLFFVSKSGRRRDVSILKSAYLDNIRLSPDGRTIAFASDLNGRDNIWLIPAQGGQPRKITSNSDSRLYFSSMAFSPDGKTIYFGKQSRSSVTSMIDNFR